MTNKTSYTLLLAEDDALMRRVMARSLERLGYIVLEAENGKQALDLICHHQGPIDLLLTDVIMPLMDGRKLADIAQGLRPGLPVLFMSAYTERMIVAEGVLKTGEPFINKAFTTDQLAQMVRLILGQKETQPALP